ncbi:High mobility group B protein 9 [Capsicum annuum]|nr:High mobility group B protein 9 [Capsicum annuum]
MSFQAEGTIYGKFDDGYLVSIKLGSEVLDGVLYHQYQQVPSPSSGLSGQTCNSVAPSNSGSGNNRRKRRDANLPKSKRSGYNFFFAEQHSMLKSLRLRRDKEFTKKIAESWNNLSPEEKKVYQNYGMEDQERYQRELKEYKKRTMTTSEEKEKDM